ncbi:carbohydrate ABC transporter permease [Actimicrobium sp. CCC2.4]|uniref:carbohydrate ABC transporter permease n=1 Tax=Actimicrobium sp. CCC2.4 TaxID=3048606 RepID=UPI002AC90A34|nr:carbohydrate ABC transporter permease [Actimicrobium sp. CCC2.4]MEB0137209.1 carbohydrate ABC transporter permease [Actimicrobium sp. CCC2.4]WPX32506.1 carbohydrate ABC transporter permease [Actimicrobium sp. CCC2.4]
MHAEQKGFPGIGRIVIYLLLALVALYYLIPLYVMLTTSVKTLAEIRSGNLLDLPMSPSGAAWAKAWSGACTGVRCDGLQPFFWNSVLMAVPAVLLSTLIGSLNGYVLAHWRFRYSEIVFTALMVGCFIPFQVVILPMARLLGMFGLSNTTTGLVMVHIIYGVAFTTLFFRNYYVSVPEELVKAARIDGAGFFMIYRRIIFPLSLPIFMVCFIWQFTQIWNDFLFGVVFGGSDAQPVTVALNNLVNTTTGVREYNVNMAAAIIAALPTLVIYLIAGKYFVRGLTAGAVKG